MPSFRALAAELKVSLITVKRAYEDLEREGLIFRKQGMGAFYGKLGAKWAAPFSRGRLVFDAWAPVGGFLGFVAVAIGLRQWMDIPAQESIVLAFQSVLAPVCAIGALLLIDRGALLVGAAVSLVAYRALFSVLTSKAPRALLSAQTNRY